MSDQAEKIILEAEDQVSPVVDKANAGLDSFEKKAESVHGKVIRITDQTRSSVQRLIASLEKQADTYGKSGVDRLISQRDQLLQRYNREPAAIDAITKSYEKMIAVEEKAAREASAAKAAKEAEEALRKQSDAMKSFGDRIGQFMANPLQGARGALSSVLSSLGPFGTGVMASVTALIAFGAAGFEAAKSLGEYGTQVKDLELRTGLAAKEVGQFGFAAKAVGQDASIYERMMRGLAQAADDTSKEGEKARATLQKMGVTMYDSMGAIKPTAQILEEISGGLARMPNALERDAAAMALFKRAGVEAIPVITELSENLRIAKEQGYGPTEEEVRRFVGYQREVAEIETSWDRFKRNLEVPLVATVNFLFDGMKWAAFMASLPGKLIMGKLFNGTPTATDTEMSETEGWGYGASMSRSGHAAEQRSISTNDAMVAAARVSDQTNKQLELAENKLRELQGELKTGVFPSVNEPVLKQISQQRELIAWIKAQAEAAKELKKFQTEAATFEKRSDEAELDAIGKIYYQRDLLLKQAAQVKASEADVAAIRKSADEQASVIMEKSWKEFQQYDEKRSADQRQKAMGLFLPSKEQVKEWEDEFKARGHIDDIAVEAQREVLRRESTRQAKAAETPEEGYQIRVKLAAELAEIEVARIQKEDSAAKRMEMAARAQKDLYTELAQAQDELDDKRKAAEQERVEELQRQVDEIQKVSSSLLHTLFTTPQEFGKQLRDTIREAMIKPVTEGVGGMVANAIHPLIYGSDGQGGVAGMLKGAFGGHQDPVKVSTDINTAATMQNSAVVAMLTGVLAGFMGMGAPAMATPMSIPGAGGISLPSISVPAVARGGSASESMTAAGGGYSTGGWSSSAAAGGGYSPVGGYSPAPWAGGGAAGMNPLAMILGSGSGAKGGPSGIYSLFSKGGFSKALSNIKGTVWNQDAWNASDSNLWGGVQGIAKSPAAGAAGMMLASSGLLGSQRGTWTGAVEDTAGGALIGEQIGGPLGAGIGAAAGFAAGVAEILAGVESPQRKAHDDIKSIYGVDIPQNSGTIKQVVQIAQSQFGGDIAVAVRSPNVRQLVMLYSEATGQKMPLSATTPYAGSLVEQGGNLYQQASFQNNSWNSRAERRDASLAVHRVQRVAGVRATSEPISRRHDSAVATRPNVAPDVPAE